MGSSFPADSLRSGARGHRLLPIAIAALLVTVIGVALIVGARRVKLRRAPAVAQARAFYYWKTQWLGSDVITHSLAENGIGRLYMRFFDVDWQEPLHAGQPVSPLQIGAPLPVGVEIIPVVFITNRVFLNTPNAQVEALAENVLRKITRMAAADGIALGEVQLDCDWSDRTRTRYFQFLEQIGRRLHAQKLRLSSTIRLHQIKYAARTGVPPVDRGMLMFYNFGPLRADAPRSSIFNVEDAERYASYIASYTLPLDLALPIFSWSVHSRDGAVMGLLDKLETRDIEGAGAFRARQPGIYQAERSLFFRGHYFMEGDELRMEETTPKVTRQAATVAAHGATSNKRYGTIAFFDLDERTLRHYAKSDLQDIFAALR
jgi:hypothetical protein